MDHEVLVPVLPAAVRHTLADPARVARCLPGFQQDADKSSTPLTGRLKVRLGGHTITYRGALTVTAAPKGPKGVFTVEGEGAEARGNGSVKLTLTVRTARHDDGTKLSFSGTAHGDGRITELDAPTVESAVHRLLDRFGSRLGTEAAGPGPRPAPQRDPKPDRDAKQDRTSGPDRTSRPDEPRASVFETEVPQPSLDRLSDEELTEDDPLPGSGPTREDEEIALREALAGLPGELPDAFPDEPPAEAAHARRTMIGRSAEEVDHAPPRGRYAPVMAPAPASGTFTLRRLAPAAALAVASAVVVGRVLRRRR
ncbi:SRPBCC domain-containing protein [Streptomyces sp. NPDC087440]|uniref:SRPBCC domain-containing protein n=1 Tax=Streptomyces sp. NPDC087440 TaxID=3365790 RepID=UPI00381168A4